MQMADLYYSAFFVKATDVSATIFGGTHTSLFPVETDGDIGMPRKMQISPRSGYTQQRGEQGSPYSAIRQTVAHHIPSN